MAASSMKDIKLRIKSVESTMQITKAMELVASSKLRRAKERAEETRPYFTTLHECLTDIAYGNTDFSSPFVQQREVKKTCYIMIAGDRGLAGVQRGGIRRDCSGICGRPFVGGYGGERGQRTGGTAYCDGCGQQKRG